jgi:hypothetical protein
VLNLHGRLMILALMVTLLPIVALLIVTLLIVTLAVVALMLLGLLIVGLLIVLGLTAFAVGHLRVARGLLVLRARLILDPLALYVHHAEIVLGVLEEILGGDPISRRLRLARQRQIAFEHLIGVAADFDIGTVAVEGLRPMRWTGAAATSAAAIEVVVVIWIAAAVAAAPSLLWSHDTCLVAVNPVGPSSTRMLGTHPLGAAIRSFMRCVRTPPDANGDRVRPRSS